MRCFFKLWIVCSLVHLMAFGVAALLAFQIMDVSREPSSVTFAALEIARVLLFPAIYLLSGHFQIALVVANSVLWGFGLAGLLVLGKSGFATLPRRTS
ncbi:MAG: hypothetical protein U0793_07715 [Gemmataceae bacterium]